MTKTEWLLLAMAAVFLAALALLYVRAAAVAEGTDYTITTGREAEEETAPAPETEPAAPAGPVDINTADLDQLQTLSGIGPVLAQRIIDYREANGPFSSVEELLEVKGIGEATLEKVRDQVVAAAETEEPEEDLSAEEAAA